MIYKPKHFPIEELIPESMMHLPGHRLWMLFDPRGLLTLDMLRKRYGAMVVNNYKYDGDNHFCGYRPPNCKVGSEFSQHRFGRGFDPHPTDFTAEDIRQDIKQLNYEQRNSVGLGGIRRMEEGISWLHFDTGNFGLVEGEIRFFKP